jgi:WD40 repeat protein
VHFVSSSVDKNILLWHIDGEVLHKWNGVRATDLAVTFDGKTLVAISDKKIRLYDLESKDELG